MPAKAILPVRADESVRNPANPALSGPIATLDETLEVNAAARDELAKARKGRSVPAASALAIDEALGHMANAAKATARALAAARRAAGVTS